MTETYKEFDKAPIVEEDIVFRGYKFRKRELFLGGAVAVLALVCVILIAVLASQAKGKQASELPPTTGAQTGGPGGEPSGPGQGSSVCLTSACLHSASSMLDNLNTTVDPCENFFQYACGGFPTHHPIPPDRPQLSTRWNIFYENQVKLRRLMEAPIIRNTEWSAERKLKDFFISCTDSYAKMLVGGNPFLQRVVPEVGGWWVLGTLNESSYNFQAALKKTHVDFWTNAFFTFYVKTDILDWHKRSLQIDLSGVGMSWIFMTAEETERERQEYKKFMRTIAGYLIRDANLTLNETERNRRIETFVNDAFAVEYMLSKMTADSEPSPNPHSLAERISLQDLNAQTSGGIDWVDFFSYMFSEAHVNRSTMVIVLEFDYLKRMDKWISDLGSNKTRVLNNYLTWRLAHKYVQDLSWDYVHANREFWVAMNGQAEFLGPWQYCYQMADRDMTYAVSSLYVRDHFSDKDRQKAMEIVMEVREALIQALMKLTWMDQPTRTAAESKLRATLLKLGYPDFMVDDDRMDEIYKDLKIVRHSYFDNMLSLNKFYKKDWNMRLREKTDPSEWTYHTYDVAAEYFNPWNELMVPAGLLQPPFYSHKLPHFTNFGAIGTVLAQKLLQAVNEQGAQYKLDGSWFGQWWTNFTVQRYQSVRNCYINLFANKTQGPFLLPFEGPTTVAINALDYAPEALSETSGIRIAYEAYQAWTQKNGQELRSPGLNLTNEQTFFVAYAQGYCYNRHDILSYNQAARHEIQENIKVNMALRQSNEFARAFNCKSGSKMLTEKKCPTF